MPASDPIFVDRVIKHLRGQPVNNPAPSSYRAYIPPIGPGIDASLFNADSDETYLYIMTPIARNIKDEKSKLLEYPIRARAIATAVKRHIGKTPETVESPYLRLNYNLPEEEALENRSRRGMALFQYDPNSDGNGKRAYRLFLEEKFRDMELYN
jgi:hypothetical protein